MSAAQFSTLAVSSDRAWLRQLTRFLDMLGYQAEAVACPEAARRRLLVDPPDFLIVQGAPSDQDSLRLLRAVRQHPRDRYTYALLACAEPSLQDIADALQAGCDDFLAQPLVFGELLARLRAGARVIEFERRHGEQAGSDRLPGWETRPRFLAALRGAAGYQGSLALLQLDGLELVRRCGGQALASSLQRQAAEFLARHAGDAVRWAAWDRDRFAAWIPGQEEASAAEFLAEAARSCAAAWAAEASARGVEAEGWPLSLSGGVASGDRKRPIEAIAERAAQALALAQQSGGDCLLTAREADDEVAAWTEEALGGRIFAATTARDVMAPCPLLLHADESVEQALSLLRQTELPAIPVVDREGRLAGLVTRQLLTQSLPPRDSRLSGSMRLVQHVMHKDVPRLDERASLSDLLEFFSRDPTSLAVVVRGRRPTGLVHGRGLASLNERLTREQFLPAAEDDATSRWLIVPELAAGEAAD